MRPRLSEQSQVTCGATTIGIVVEVACFDILNTVLGQALALLEGGGDHEHVDADG